MSSCTDELFKILINAKRVLRVTQINIMCNKKELFRLPNNNFQFSKQFWTDPSCKLIFKRKNFFFNLVKQFLKIFEKFIENTFSPCSKFLKERTFWKLRRFGRLIQIFVTKIYLLRNVDFRYDFHSIILVVFGFHTVLKYFWSSTRDCSAFCGCTHFHAHYCMHIYAKASIYLGF